MEKTFWKISVHRENIDQSGAKETQVNSYLKVYIIKMKLRNFNGKQKEVALL